VDRFPIFTFGWPLHSGDCSTYEVSFRLRVERE
jgi:hypothetical protein